MMSTSKRLRELAANFEKWHDTEKEYQAHFHLKNEDEAAAYHRGAKEAFDRCLDRTRQLFFEELKKP